MVNVLCAALNDHYLIKFYYMLNELLAKSIQFDRMNNFDFPLTAKLLDEITTVCPGTSNSID